MAGYTTRISGVQTSNGRDAWVWSGSSTIQVGFFGSGYIGANGRQESEITAQSGSGQVAGYSARFDGAGRNVGSVGWVWNGAATTQVGLTGPEHTGSGGVQYCLPEVQNAAGQVAGITGRYIGVETFNGQNAWVWNGTSTRQIGLSGAIYTGSAGYQYSDVRFQSPNGIVAGYSERYTGERTPLGRDAWAWDGAGTRPIGLSGAAYTGSAGYQYSAPELQNADGQIAGTSMRITGASSRDGADCWLWDGTSTRQINPTGGVYTGSAGFQESGIFFLNDAGQVAGFSNQIIGVNTYLGQDAWYFDPVTQFTTAIIGSVRASDGYTFSQPTLLTADGFMMGYYQYFAGGAGASADRAFIFRPDLGFTDLGDLVNGGLTASGWSTLQRPHFADAIRTMIGYGYVNGQTAGQSVFVMTIPSPAATALLGFGGLAATRRRRA